jgi:hypothetical protein
VIIQPSYLPWRGFFHLLWLADTVVFLDDVQYDTHSWRNRNRIKGVNGAFWLTVPVRIPAWPPPEVNQVEIDNSRNWRRKHRESIRQSYGGSAWASEYLPLVEGFLERPWTNLAELDIHTTIELARTLGFQRDWLRCSELRLAGAPFKPTERLIRICEAVGATHYLSGPTAKDYMDAPLFADAGVELQYMEYDYRPYEQRFGGFEPRLSVIDLLLNCGPRAAAHIWEPRARLASSAALEAGSSRC